MGGTTSPASVQSDESKGQQVGVVGKGRGGNHQNCRGMFHMFLFSFLYCHYSNGKIEPLQTSSNSEISNKQQKEKKLKKKGKKKKVSDLFPKPSAAVGGRGRGIKSGGRGLGTRPRLLIHSRRQHFPFGTGSSHYSRSTPSTVNNLVSWTV